MSEFIKNKDIIEICKDLGLEIVNYKETVKFEGGFFSTCEIKILYTSEVDFLWQYTIFIQDIANIEHERHFGEWPNETVLL